MEPFEGYDKILKNQNVGVKGIAYPLQFTTKHARNRAHTVYDNVSMIRDQFDYPKRGSMNPVDAAKRGISDGDTVYIYNDWGCMKVKVSISNRTGEGVVELPHGVWYRASTDANDTYEAWYDLDMGNSVGSKTASVTEFDNSGKPVQVTKTFYKYVTKIDVGGCENVLTHDKDQGPRDPLCGQIGNNHFNGNLCEVSTIKPA
jgi:anaerobic dimethyl sulfoxide reductase subunit A